MRGILPIYNKSQKLCILSTLTVYALAAVGVGAVIMPCFVHLLCKLSYINDQRQYSGWMVCNLIPWQVGWDKGDRLLTGQMLSGSMETKSLALIVYIPCLVIHCSVVFVSASCSGCVVIIFAAVQATFFLLVCQSPWIVLAL